MNFRKSCSQCIHGRAMATQAAGDSADVSSVQLRAPHVSTEPPSTVVPKITVADGTGNMSGESNEGAAWDAAWAISSQAEVVAQMRCFPGEGGGDGNSIHRSVSPLRSKADSTQKGARFISAARIGVCSIGMRQRASAQRASIVASRNSMCPPHCCSTKATSSLCPLLAADVNFHWRRSAKSSACAGVNLPYFTTAWLMTPGSDPVLCSTRSKQASCSCCESCAIRLLISTLSSNHAASSALMLVSALDSGMVRSGCVPCDDLRLSRLGHVVTVSEATWRS